MGASACASAATAPSSAAANYPECRYTRPFATGEAGDGEAPAGDRELGVDPETGKPVLLKVGRFGPYVELAAEGDAKPRRSSLPKGWGADTLDLVQALRLLVAAARDRA